MSSLTRNEQTPRDRFGDLMYEHKTVSAAWADVEIAELQRELDAAKAENERLKGVVKDAYAEADLAKDFEVSLRRERDQLKSCVVSTEQALQAAERVIASAHAYWDSDQDAKVGKLLIAMLSDDLKYSDDCTIFRTGIQALKGRPAPKAQLDPYGNLAGPDFEDGPEFEGWEQRSGQPKSGGTV